MTPIILREFIHSNLVLLFIISFYFRLIEQDWYIVRTLIVINVINTLGLLQSYAQCSNLPFRCKEFGRYNFLGVAWKLIFMLFILGFLINLPAIQTKEVTSVRIL